ncbi:unnamed protein product [Allacma fusca]|uniref:F-box domain-containing protein n=1 Tax=Allacma fusca TaxID=39272 RepID=A0A8J2Q4N4_9HEXA|nr:unnamed protein product [Allacma fusca]
MDQISETVEESIITANDLILKRILHFTAFPDLLTCRLVSTRWKHLSQFVLLQERKCFAKIGSDKPCQQLVRLNEFLQDSEGTPPFNGLSMGHSYHFVDHCLQDIKLLRTIYSAVLEHCPIRYLNVHLDQYTDCLAMQFIKILVEERGAEIQELSVSTTDFEFPFLLDFFSNTKKDMGKWLPNLISLELKTEQDGQLLQEMVAVAPNLQSHNLASCFEFSKLQPKLESLWISSRDYHGGSDNDTYVPELCSTLLNSSSASLNYLDIDHLDLVLLVSKTQFCLETLSSLNVDFNLGLDRYLGYFSISRINFQELFPNLKMIKISTSKDPYSVRDLKSIPESFKNSDSFYSSQSVVNVQIRGTPFRPVSLSARIPLARVFPNVKHVGIKYSSDITSYLEYVLPAWPDLESLQITANEYPKNLTNLDRIFCGTSEEESFHLQSWESKEPGCLQNYQIVPLKRSLLHSKYLKSLKIRVCHNDSCPLNTRSSQVLLSAVSGHLVFSRIPHLRLEIMRSLCGGGENGMCYFTFNDLHPFAKLSTDSDSNYP